MEERLARKINVTETCWLWTGALVTGYGSLRRADGHHLAHRYVYEALVGPIPEGMDLDHLCHNADASCEGGWSCAHRRCVNPAHLEPTTHRQNILRGVGTAARNARKTHCDSGHPLSGANLRIARRRDGRERRVCVACQTRNKQRWVERQRGNA